MRGLVTETGDRLAGLRPHPRAVADNFERSPSGLMVPIGDGLLGDWWTDAHSYDPGAYEPLGCLDGSAHVLDPMTRVGANYAANQDSSDPRPEQYVGIGAAWGDLGKAAALVRLEWSGLIKVDADGGGPGHHVEASPLANVVPGSAELGLGLWPSFLFGAPAFLMASVGYPPEGFVDVLYGVAFFAHVDGTPRFLDILTTGTAVKFFLDGVQIPVGVVTAAGTAAGWALGAGWQPLPPALHGSTLHGLEFDTHLVSPPRNLVANIPAIPVAHSFLVRPA